MKPPRTKPKRLEIIPFGKKLLKTRDLDPVYVLLYHSNLKGNQLYRWLLAYWCYYHVGTASWICGDEQGYWRRMLTAAKSSKYPRCHERRHFRGAFACEVIEKLQQQGVSKLFEEFINTPIKLKVQEIIHYITRNWFGFGPWIAFKIADMLERLDLCPVLFDKGTLFLFESPVQGAELLYSHLGEPLLPPGKSIGQWAVDYILRRLGRRKAPPRYERKLNVQEAETILCKWKSHMGNHYSIKEDVQSCYRGLWQFRSCHISLELFEAGQLGKLWKAPKLKKV